MTNAEWRACTDPTPMLAFLRGKASDRKLRLLACGCCRRVWALLPGDRCLKAVKVAERFADGLADAASLARVRGRIRYSFIGFQTRRERAENCAAATAWATALESAEVAAEMAMRTAASTVDWAVEGAAGAERATQSAIVRDLFGNPFQPVAANPAWLTSTVLSFARAIYADRAFDRLPILADALEDGGCDDAAILAHCRGNGPHVRGCWALDLVLGKQ